MCLGVLALWGINQVFLNINTDTPQNPETEIEISLKEYKPSFEEYCKDSPLSPCLNNTMPTDFLYKDDPVVIVKAEEFSPQLLDKKLSTVSLSNEFIADIVQQNTDLAPKANNNTELFAQIPSLESDLVENLYEEKLPEDILENNHKQHKNNIIPSRKPPYFGEIPVIAIVIDDMGISLSRTADITKINAPITASFLTYGKNLEQQIINSKNAGHEIIIHIPMEAKSNTDVAPDVLTTQMSQDEIQLRLRTMLAKFSNIKGANNHMGSKLTEDKERMSAVMKVLKNNGMFFLDSKTSPHSTAEEAAKETGIAYAHRHVFIDNNNDKAYILGQLKKAENVAKKNGYAIAIGHPKTKTYEALKEWILQLPKKNLKLLPLSHIVATLNPNIKNQ